MASSKPLLNQGQENLGPSPSKQALKQIFGEELPPDPQESEYLKRFIILPWDAPDGKGCLEMWDLYIGALVLAVAYYEPYLLALYAPRQGPVLHTIINSVFNISFTIDMLLQFFIATQHSQDSNHTALWEKDIRKIAKAYCRTPCSHEGGLGWFWVDLATVLPGWCMAFLVDPSMGNPLYVLRIVQLFQTARLTRLRKLGYMLQARFGFPFFIASVCKFILVTTLACHWMACTWVLVEGKVTHGLMSYSTDQASWLSALIEAKGDSCYPDAARNPFCVLILAYYWATMTLTSVGYGDITPQNEVEYCIAVLCMITVGYLWAFIVGTIVSILSNLDPSSVEFKRALDDLGQLMKRRGLPHSLRVRLRTYMHETRHFQQVYNQRQLVEQYLSEGLQREIAAHSLEVRGILKNVYWMRDLQKDAILDIVRSLRPKAYAPKEYIPMKSSMILLQRGLAGVKGRVLARGDVWGQNDILMETENLIDTSMPRALSFVSLLALTKDALVEVCHRYPRADERLRRAQIRTATARSFIYEAKKIKLALRFARARRARTSMDLIEDSSVQPVPSGPEVCRERSFANTASENNNADMKKLLEAIAALDKKVSSLAVEVRVLKEAN